MLKKLLPVFVVFTLIAPAKLSAQFTFMKHYGASGAQDAYAVKQCFDGGYIACGYSSAPFNSYCPYVVRLNAYGDTLWTRKFQSNESSVAFDIIQTHDSNFVWCGYINTQNSQVRLYKLDQNGDSIWAQRFGAGDWAQSLQETSDHGFALAGSRMYLTDSTGAVTWNSNTVAFQLMYIAKTNDGGYAMVSSGFGNILLTKSDSTGTQGWQKTYPGYLYNPTNNSVTQTPDGGYAITGLSPGFRAYLIRTDSAGDTLWTRTMAGNYGAGVVNTIDGGFAVVSSDTNKLAMHFTRFDSTGNIVFSQDYNYYLSEWGHSIAATTDGGFILSGCTTSFYTLGFEAFFVKTDSSGFAIGVGIEEPENADRTRVFPNPVSSSATVQFDSPLQDATISVLNVLGETVQQESNISTGVFDFQRNNLPAGLYFIEVTENNMITHRVPVMLSAQ